MSSENYHPLELPQADLTILDRGLKFEMVMTKTKIGVGALVLPSYNISTETSSYAHGEFNVRVGSVIRSGLPPFTTIDKLLIREWGYTLSMDIGVMCFVELMESKTLKRTLRLQGLLAISFGIC